MMLIVARVFYSTIGPYPSTPRGETRTWREVHLAVDTLGYLLALHITPNNAQDRAPVSQWTVQVQHMTGETVGTA